MSNKIAIISILTGNAAFHDEGGENDQAASGAEQARILRALADEIEHDGLLWLMDHGIKTDNAIYYSHTDKFCFGWRKPLEAEELGAWLDVASEFPFEYELKKA